MSQLPSYSTLFSTLYDEQAPIGHLGRGTHYSVFRSVEWLNVERKPLIKPQIHDFAIIWDEDHDTRVIQAVEQIYMSGLLSPVQFIGERKGTLTVLVAARFWGYSSESEFGEYVKQISEVSLMHDDPWPVEVGLFDRSPAMGMDFFPGTHSQDEMHHQCDSKGIINDNEHRVLTYLKNVDSLWGLGTKDYIM